MKNGEVREERPDDRPGESTDQQQSQPDDYRTIEALELQDGEDESAPPASGSDRSPVTKLDALFPVAVTVESEAAEQQSPALPYPVVGFGASAGGLQAFKEILENLNPNTGMSFVLVTHLAPDQKSFLSEIVERYTQMPVHSIEDGQRLQPNHIYVLLPNQTLTLRDGLFRVEPRSSHDRIPRTIDTFFRSLAAEQKNHAIGVVLSGADSDGALGLKTIKGEGGIAIVQSPDSAVHSGMPLSSIASDHIDLVIPPAEIAVELDRLARQFSRPEVRSLQDGSISPDDEQSFQKILQHGAFVLRSRSPPIQAGNRSSSDRSPHAPAPHGATRFLLSVPAGARRRTAPSAGRRFDQRNSILPRWRFLGVAPGQRPPRPVTRPAGG